MVRTNINDTKIYVLANSFLNYDINHNFLQLVNFKTTKPIFDIDVITSEPREKFQFYIMNSPCVRRLIRANIKISTLIPKITENNKKDIKKIKKYFNSTVKNFKKLPGCLQVEYLRYADCWIKFIEYNENYFLPCSLTKEEKKRLKNKIAERYYLHYNATCDSNPFNELNEKRRLQYEERLIMTCDVINNFNKLDNIQKKSKSSEKTLEI